MTLLGMVKLNRNRLNVRIWILVCENDNSAHPVSA